MERPWLTQPHHAPATVRNREPILAVLREILPVSGLVLEIASGTGEHASFFAPHFPALIWQPSDADAAMLPHIAMHAARSGATNLRPPCLLDVRQPVWALPAEQRATAILAINLIHIAPWSVAEALLARAGALLPEGGVLYLYGAYRRDGRHLAESNAVFDERLRALDPGFGVRDLEAVIAEAMTRGFELLLTRAMPANNLSVVFRRRGGSTVRTG